MLKHLTHTFYQHIHIVWHLSSLIKKINLLWDSSRFLLSSQSNFSEATSPGPTLHRTPRCTPECPTLLKLHTNLLFFKVTSQHYVSYTSNIVLSSPWSFRDFWDCRAPHFWAVLSFGSFSHHNVLYSFFLLRVFLAVFLMGFALIPVPITMPSKFRLGIKPSFLFLLCLAISCTRG